MKKRCNRCGVNPRHKDDFWCKECIEKYQKKKNAKIISEIHPEEYIEGFGEMV